MLWKYELPAMRTTINIAEDALLAARHLAQRERMPLGDAISQLVRCGAVPLPAAPTKQDAGPRRCAGASPCCRRATKSSPRSMCAS